MSRPSIKNTKNLASLGSFQKALEASGPLADLRVGGVSIKNVAMKDASSIVKNKDIFEKA